MCKSTRFRSKISHIAYGLLILLTLNSCNAYKEIPYLKGDKDLPVEIFDNTGGIHEAKIMPNDIISITVNSNIAGAANDFNLPLTPSSTSQAVQSTISTASATTGSVQNYIVDKNGIINFPVLGKIDIGGMTLSDAQDHITAIIYPRYIAQEPIVNIRFLNFSIAVLGEVNSPGVYSSSNGQMTIFDALASAGDMTIHGKRNNVLLVRLAENGNIETYRLDFQDRELISKPELFYLQQNDKLYIEPNKAKANNSRFGTMETIGLSALSIVISVISIVTR